MEIYPCPQYLPPSMTVESLDTLFQSMADGVKEVQYADKKIVYQSFDDMRKIYDWMYGMLYPCSSVRAPMSVGVMYASGLNRSRGSANESEEYFRYF